METHLGLCQCGCGQKTSIAKQNLSSRGWEKGIPIRFISGHNSKGENNPNWKGGKTINNYGYLKIHLPEHLRADPYGYVLNHILVAEKALGKPLPPGSEVHHFPNIKKCTNLVICEDKTYHKLLELRYRAFKACGHAHWRRCWYCKKWDDPINLYDNRRHKECHRRYERERYQKNKAG